MDGRPVISTGTPSLDGLFAGHAGFALGHSLLIEETSSTDYAGTLLRYFAAEGVAQGHKVHVVGYGPSWGKELPGIVAAEGTDRQRRSSPKDAERMKIAWRYQRLGEFGADSGRGASSCQPVLPSTLWPNLWIRWLMRHTCSIATAR